MRLELTTYSMAITAGNKRKPCPFSNLGRKSLGEVALRTGSNRVKAGQKKAQLLQLLHELQAA